MVSAVTILCRATYVETFPSLKQHREPWVHQSTHGALPLLVIFFCSVMLGTARNSLVAVVVKLVVACIGKEDPKSWAEREENLSRCIHPHLKNRCDHNVGRHYRMPYYSFGCRRLCLSPFPCFSCLIQIKMPAL